VRSRRFLETAQVEADMKTFRWSLMLAAAFVGGAVQFGAAQGLSGRAPVLLGTTGACNNATLGGPCRTTSTLVQVDPQTGALIRMIGPVGYTVNGLAWDETSGKLYATTAPGDALFHGLITIDPDTGAGTPVDPTVINFGLPLPSSPIHSITIDFFGRMVGWYDEFPPPATVTDTFVRINKRTGVATEFPDTGIDTAQNGLSFSEFNLLWNIDTPRLLNGAVTQRAYLLNPLDGKPFFSRLLSPPTPAALGDFNPANNLYYGLNFDTSFPPPFPTFIVAVNLVHGTVTTIGRTVDNLHTLTFVKRRR
jgi:hypothetical protein